MLYVYIHIYATVPRALLVCLGDGHLFNLNHQCSILILIWMVVGVLDCPFRDQHPISYTPCSAPPPRFCNLFSMQLFCHQFLTNGAPK